MRGCFRCGGSKNHGLFTVGVWQATDSPHLFGLGSVDPKTGEVCCSFREGDFKTYEEAKEEADSTDVQELYAEHQIMQEEDMSDYGPPDSDPYDRDYSPYC